jgi:hypothetical protein
VSPTLLGVLVTNWNEDDEAFVLLATRKAPWGKTIMKLRANRADTLNGVSHEILQLVQQANAETQAELTRRVAIFRRAAGSGALPQRRFGKRSHCAPRRRNRPFGALQRIPSMSRRRRGGSAISLMRIGWEPTHSSRGFAICLQSGRSCLKPTAPADLSNLTGCSRPLSSGMPISSTATSGVNLRHRLTTSRRLSRLTANLQVRLILGNSGQTSAAARSATCYAISPARSRRRRASRMVSMPYFAAITFLMPRSVSTLFTVCRDTPHICARSDWVSRIALPSGTACA